MLPYLFEPHRPSPNSVLLLLPDMPPSPSRGKDSYPARSPGSQTSCSPHGPPPNEFPFLQACGIFQTILPWGPDVIPPSPYCKASLLEALLLHSACNLYVAHGMWCPPPGCECIGPVNCWQYHLSVLSSITYSVLPGPWGKTLYPRD